MRVRHCTSLGGMLLGVAALAGAPRDAKALINVTLRPMTQTVFVGDQVSIGVYAASDSESTQLLSALQMIFTWDVSKLQLTGISSAGAPSLTFAGFPTTAPSGLNETDPPHDGNGMFYALDQPGTPIGATQAGTLISTLTFNALAPTPLTPLTILPSAGSPPDITAVLDGTVPNLDVTGVVTGGSVTILPVPAPGAGAAFVFGALALTGRRRR